MRERAWIACGAVIITAGVSGCGGGSSQDDLRQDLQQGVARIGQAKQLTASQLLQTVPADGSGSQDAGCVNVDYDAAGPGAADDRVSMTAFDLNCSGGAHGYTVQSIGRQVWAQADGGPWRAARMTPGLLTQLTSSQDDLDQVIKAAQDIQHADAGDRYTFSVPASTLNPDADDDATALQMTATLDANGALHELETAATADDVEARSQQTYELGRAPAIEVPKAADVTGKVADLRTTEELHAFIESVWGCAPPTALETRATC